MLVFGGVGGACRSFGACACHQFAEQPACLALDDMNLREQWKPSADAGYTMQANLVLASSAFGLIAAWMTFDWRWVLGVCEHR